jgi:hypothetical protein
VWFSVVARKSIEVCLENCLFGEGVSGPSLSSDYAALLFSYARCASSPRSLTLSRKSSSVAIAVFGHWRGTGIARRSPREPRCTGTSIAGGRFYRHPPRQNEVSESVPPKTVQGQGFGAGQRHRWSCRRHCALASAPAASAESRRRIWRKNPLCEGQDWTVTRRQRVSCYPCQLPCSVTRWKGGFCDRRGVNRVTVLPFNYIIGRNGLPTGAF